MTLVPDDRGGLTLVTGGVPQSHVQPDDPLLLAFDYMQHLATGLDLLPPGRLAVTHVGGGAMTLARYVAATRPGSPQVVLEPDVAATELVRRELPLPRGHRVRVRPVAGRAGVAALADGSADAVVLDAFAQGRVPADLGTLEFLTDVARVLRPGGLFLANLADEPGLRYAARVLAGVARRWPTVAVVAATEVAKGRRFGNVVVLAGGPQAPQGWPAALARRVASLPLPTTLLTGPGLSRRIGSAAPWRDEDAQRSPQPPPAGQWRLR